MNSDAMWILDTFPFVVSRRGGNPIMRVRDVLSSSEGYGLYAISQVVRGRGQNQKVRVEEVIGLAVLSFL